MFNMLWSCGISNTSLARGEGLALSLTNALAS